MTKIYIHDTIYLTSKTKRVRQLKFLYFGDKHERITSPENRIDNYRETQSVKTKEIIEIGKRHNIKAFLQPGDFFHTHNPSLAFVSQIIKEWTGESFFTLLQDFTSNKITGEEMQSKAQDFIPIIGTVGNHELLGNSIKNLKTSPPYFLEEVGLMKLVTKDEPMIFEDEDGLTVAITGTHYHHFIDTPEYIDDYVVEEKLGDIHIHIVHGMLSDKGMGPYIRHTLIDDIKHTKADLTITGHDHIGFPLREVDGKYFVNPGAIIRQTNSLKELKRSPKVMLIEATTEDGLKIDFIPLRTALKGDEVLSREKIEDRQAKEARFHEFEKEVRASSGEKNKDIVEIIRELEETPEITKEIKEELIEGIVTRKQKVEGDFETSVEDGRIEKILMENFQSHEYTEMEFDDGFNVFVGESKQGKTSVMRAFQWVYENKPAGRRVIKKGKDYARVTLYLKNGIVITRHIELKGHGKNGYYIYDPKTEETTFHNTKILPTVQRMLSYHPLVIDKDSVYNLNFMKQGSGWFLIGNEFSGPEKAKIIGGLYGTQYADAVVRELDVEERRSNDRIKIVEKDLEKTNEAIQKFDYLQDLETAIKNMEERFKRMEELEKRYKEIEERLAAYNLTKRRLKNIERTLDETKHIHDLYLRLRKLEQTLQLYDNIDEKLERVSRAKQEIANRTKVIQRIDKALEYQPLLSSIKNKVRKYEAIVEAYRKDVITKRRFANLNKTLEGTKHIRELHEKAILLKHKINQTSLLENAIKKHKQLQSELNKTNAIIKKCEHDKDQSIKRYSSLIESLGTCPVCLGEIDHSTTHRIIHQLQK